MTDDDSSKTASSAPDSNKKSPVAEDKTKPNSPSAAEDKKKAADEPKPPAPVTEDHKKKAASSPASEDKKKDVPGTEDKKEAPSTEDKKKEAPSTEDKKKEASPTDEPTKGKNGTAGEGQKDGGDQQTAASQPLAAMAPEASDTQQTTAPTATATPDPDALPKVEGGKFQGLNARLAFAICAAAFGSAFQHGYNLSVVNTSQAYIEEWLNVTEYNSKGEYLDKSKVTLLFSNMVSIYCAGGMIGGALTGLIAERFGRKGGLLFNNIFAIIAAFLFGFCKMASSYGMLVAGRVVIGINSGLNAGLCPMYLSEIAPVNLRGAIGTVYQLVLTISILFAQIMGMQSILGTDNLWPIALALTGLGAAFQLLTLPLCPESPKFLIGSKDDPVSAQRALTWLRSTNNVQEEMAEMRNEAEAAKLVPSVSVREIIWNPTLRIPLIISLMMMLAQQLSGINAVIFFSTDIYKNAGLTDDAAIYATIAMGTMNVLMTFISLVMVEKFGRKTLMLVGLSGMLVDVLLFFICLLLKDTAQWISYLSILLVIVFVVMFATGPGSIPWFFVTELFAQNARPTASSIAVAVNWTAAFVVALCFLPLQQVMGPYVFLVFVALLGLFIAFTWFKVPETKGRSIDEITSMFKQQAYGGNSV